MYSICGLVAVLSFGQKAWVLQIANPHSSPQITKKIESANRNSAKCHICSMSANLEVRKFADFLEFICGPLTFAWG
jgi:hypothetical protein